MMFDSDVLLKSKEWLVSYQERIESLPCLPLMIEEIFFYSYPEIIFCANPACKNSMTGLKVSNSSIAGLHSPTMSTQFSVQTYNASSVLQ